MKKIIIVCTAVIFSATVSAQIVGSAGTNTGAVSVYKSPDILTDKAVAEAKKGSVPIIVSNNVRLVPPVATKIVNATTPEPKADKTIEPAKQVTGSLPSVLKGSSADPDAKPVLPAVNTQEVVVPAQNSGNTKPAADQKQVAKENGSVPSSTIPVKKD